ncbi:MAG: hypothetical protein L3K19_07030 [Thermoplasmata archaeon]|nr:hypothetical protein [Thermoplasmata archaeon]
MAGDPTFSPRWFERALADRLGPYDRARGRPLRLIRWEGTRAIVEVPHLLAPLARVRFSDRWTVEGRTVSTVTVRTWGTLIGAKAWIQETTR